MKILKYLLQHQIREAVRSKNFAGSLAINIFITILFGFLALQFLAIGLFADEILKELLPNENHIYLVNAYLLIYAVFDLKLRYFLQKIHGVTVVPYLHLPIKKNMLVNYLISRSFFSLFNYFPLLIIVPLGIKLLMFEYGLFSSLVWIINYYLILQCTSLFNVYVNRVSYRSSKLGLTYVFILLSVAAVYYFQLFSLEGISYIIYASVLEDAKLVFIPILLAVVLYYLNFRFMKTHLYIEDLDYSKSSDINAGSIKGLDNFGRIGQYISLEIKLLVRNKRSRTTIYFSIFFLLFGFMAYLNPTYKNGEFFYIYFGMMLTGILLISYGQFLMCWESGYYDLIISSRIKFREYLKAKYYLLIFGSTICFILVSPFALIEIEILYRNFILYIYNIGVNTAVMFYVSSYSRKSVDLDVSVMNQQGKGASQYLTVLPTIILPVLIYYPFYFLGGVYLGYAALGILGLLGLIFSPFIIDLITKQMTKQKYKMAEAFRIR